MEVCVHDKLVIWRRSTRLFGKFLLGAAMPGEKLVAANPCSFSADSLKAVYAMNKLPE